MLTLYLRADRRTRFDGFKLTVKKGVFHPLLFFSTKFFYGFLERLPLENKSFLEVGSGSGLLSLLAYRKGASVTAVDINPLAVETTKINFEKNFGKGYTARIFQSDVFSDVPEKLFDVVVVNPPYYFKDPEMPAEQAWYCGSDGDFFVKFFEGLNAFYRQGIDVYMILEENCDLNRIEGIADAYGFSLRTELQKRIRWELNTIFRISRQ